MSGWLGTLMPISYRSPLTNSPCPQDAGYWLFAHSSCTMAAMDVTKLTADDLLVDLSSHNNVTDYSAMRGLNSAGWSKATQGGGYINPLFTTQMNGMANAGMKPGAYHFPDPNVTAAGNITHFLSVARPWITDGRLLPMLDVENDAPDGVVWNAGNANSFIPAWVAELRRQMGMADLGVMIYGSDSWWGSILRPETWGDLGHLFFMVADYNGNPGQTTYQHARLAVHQYTDAAPTPGVAAPTDRSVIKRDNGFTLNDLLIGDSMTPEELLDLPINRQGSESGVTSLRQIVAWFDSDLNGLKAEIGKQLDAVKAEMEQKIAGIAAPAIDYDLLAAKIAKNLHVVLEETPAPAPTS